MKVIIDLEKCVANGRCYDFNPDVFERGEKGKSSLKYVEIPDDADLRRQAEAGYMMCPAGAISLAEE
ncbi:MAG: ferredoxin [Proteobacteria bacterium]|jgi:ferredoxin|nr:ferredoxin [Pseudomonadota bacterium]